MRRGLRGRPEGETDAVSPRWSPPLQVRETGGRCRLSLGGWIYGDGDTLHESADDLVARLLHMAECCRRSGFTACTELPPVDRGWLDFLWELGELAACGEDVRERVLGPSAAA
jgi:hypothetical protein